MIKKIIFICALIFLNWFIPVCFFSTIIIDGHHYSRSSFLRLKERRKEYYYSNIVFISNELKNNIENQYSAYINNINKLSFIEDTDNSLSHIINENIIEIETTENNFINEFENILQRKKYNFTLPLQTRDIKDKDTVMMEIFPKIYENYSINNNEYFGIAIDILKENIITFKIDFPLIALRLIEDIINKKYNQYLDNLTSQTEIIDNNDNFLQDTILSLRKQGETLGFFENLLAECELTGLPVNNTFKIGPFDISEETKPVLLPVCIIDDTVYDAFALKTISFNTNILRYNWKHLREERIENIINRQEEIISRNLSSYIDIDYGIDIDKLPALIAYYGKQINVSANFFSSELRQCIYEVEEPEKYPIDNFSDMDISPLSIEAVKINNKLYDAAAFTRLYDVIKSVKTKWESLLSSEEQKILLNINKYFLYGYENYNYDYYDIKNISFMIDYFSEVSDILKDFFHYLYDNCSIMPQDFAATVIESSITEIDIEPFLLNVTVIDGEGYYSLGVNSLQESMQNIMNNMINDIKKNISSIIYAKTNECIANIDPYLSLYFDEGNINNWLTKAVVSVQANELNKRYRQNFYPFFEIESEIQSYLLKFGEKTKKLALNYIGWLKIFQMSPYLTAKTEKIINGNDYMTPCQIVPDYIRSFIVKSKEKYNLSFFNIDDDKILNYINVMNNGTLTSVFDDKEVSSSEIDGPPGAAIKIGMNIISGPSYNITYFKAFKTQNYSAYKTLLINSFNKYLDYIKAEMDITNINPNYYSVTSEKKLSNEDLGARLSKINHAINYAADNADNWTKILNMRVTEDFINLGIKQGDDIIYDFTNVHGKIAAASIRINQGNTIKYIYIPKIKGRWNGVPGDSTFFPDLDYIPKRGIQLQDIYKFPKTWKEIGELNIEQVKNISELTPEEQLTISNNFMKFTSGETGFTFKQGMPDFSLFSYNTIDIKSFGYDKISFGRQIYNVPLERRKSVVEIGDELLAKKWNLSTVEVASFRTKWSLIWHERVDMRTIDLIPINIHNLITHRDIHAYIY